MKLSLQIPPHFKCVATLPREISDDALKPATPLTGCVINVDRAWHVAYSPNSITPTLRQSPEQVPDKVADTNHECRELHDLCPRQSPPTQIMKVRGLCRGHKS